MTIESSEDTAQMGVTDPAQQPAPERTSDAAPAVAELGAPPTLLVDTTQPQSAHDSAPPMSRKLAPPPKPKRDSGMTSNPPSARPGADGSDTMTSSAALRAPLTPSFAYPAPDSASSGGLLRHSERATAASLDGRPVSDRPLGVAGQESLNAPSPSARPVSVPPRPRSDPAFPSRIEPSPSVAPAAATSSVPARPPSSQPPSTSAIFAMRIIAVGDSARPPATQEPAMDMAPDAYPPSASRLGTGVRRSSRPVIKTPSGSPGARTPLPAAPIPTAPALPVDLSPSIEVEVAIDVELPRAEIASEPPVSTYTAAPAFAEMLPPPLAQRPVSPVEATEAPAPVRPPPPPPPAELGGQVIEADAKRDAGDPSAPALVEAEELGREDAISMPPEEVAALQAESQAKVDAAKPPPPPKRSPGVPPSGPPSDLSPSTQSGAGSVAPAHATPPTPDPAAAKAAQRAKTRQPWWEDLFSEDFMRATSRVSDEQIRREVTFIEESLGVAAGGVVLDLGCGTGHHAVEFASRGYGVVGYDLSLYQLALAADVAQERNQKINFLQGDMREMAFEEMFDGVFCWNTTFGYFEEDKNLAVAQRVFKALRPGGMFLIDVLNRDYAAASAPCSVWYEGDACVCMDDMSVDYISSRLRVKRSIILDDGRTKESLFSLRLYSLHELGKLLHEVGFRVTEASGHPATPGVFFGPNSPRIIMLAQRP